MDVINKVFCDLALRLDTANFHITILYIIGSVNFLGLTLLVTLSLWRTK